MIIGQLNIRSLNNKRSEVKDLLLRHDIDLLCVQETWLKKDETEFNNKYKIFTKNRQDGYGGVAIIIKNKIKVDVIQTPTMEVLEVIAVKIIIKINMKVEEYIIINLYIKPSANNNNIEKDLNTLTALLTNKRNVILSGDINMVHPLWDNRCTSTNSKADLMQDFLNDNMFRILNNGDPTHISY